MIKHRAIAAIVAVVMGLALAGSLWMMLASATSEAAAPDYERLLFGGGTVAIDIEVDAGDWQGLLDNAQAKEYISADLVINGQRFSTVGVRTKGNSSLSQVSADNRYSLQLNPDKYVKGQSFYGLDSLCLNNLMGDATYMKDYLSYDIMEYLGVAAPLRNYARVSVNGEDYGLFLLLERYDDSFLDRVYGSSTGELYNVKMQMGERSAFEAGEMEPRREGGGQGGAPAFPGSEGEGESSDAQTDPGRQTPRQGGGMGGGPGGFSSGGGSLAYAGDDPDSYGSIFGNAVSSKVSENDQKKVITAIQKLNKGEDLEQYWDVDGILRYLAAHTFVVNLDSYVSSMQQNYYLLEREGVLTVLPWDYNLAFGGFQSGDASAVVNFPIDTPVSGVEMADRPLVSQLLAVEEYRQRYHGYLRDIVEGYVQGGLFEAEVERLDAQLNAEVATDATAFYTYAEYEAALPVLVQLVHRRAESVAGQLDGSVPATTEGQSADPGALIDTAGIDLNALGSMMGGRVGFGGGASRGMPGREGVGGIGQGAGGDAAGADMDDFGSAAMPDVPDMEMVQEILAALQNGALTDEHRALLAGFGITEEQLAQFVGMPRREGAAGTPGQDGAPPKGEGAEVPTDAVPPGMGGPAAAADTALSASDWAAYGLTGILLAVGILLMAFYRRRKWHGAKRARE